MDITKITDIKELKSLAYDQTLTIQQSQQNLALLQQRIAELQNEVAKKEAK